MMEYPVSEIIYLSGLVVEIEVGFLLKKLKKTQPIFLIKKMLFCLQN